MSDDFGYIRQLEDYCQTNQIPFPVFQTTTDSVGFESTVWVGAGTGTGDDAGVASVRSIGFGRSEEEARNSAAKTFVIENMDKSFEQLIEIESNKSSPKVPKLAEKPINAVKATKTEAIDSSNIDIDIDNPIGYLNNRINKYGIAKFEEMGRSGADHNPIFTMKCLLSFGGTEVSGKGEARSKQEAKKLSALAVIKQLKSLNGSAKQCDSNQVLNNFFCNNFCKSEELNRYLSEEAVDYCQKLNKIANVLGCRVDYVHSFDNSNQVVLKLIVEKLDYPLITTYAASDETLDVSKLIAAEVAVNILKTLNTK